MIYIIVHSLPYEQLQSILLRPRHLQNIIYYEHIILYKVKKKNEKMINIY